MGIIYKIELGKVIDNRYNILQSQLAHHSHVRVAVVVASVIAIVVDVHVHHVHVHHVHFHHVHVHLHHVVGHEIHFVHRHGLSWWLLVGLLLHHRLLLHLEGILNRSAQ